MSRPLPGGIDPGDWLDYWLSLHPSELFPGILARFAMELLESSADGVGQRTFAFVEPTGPLEVTVEYALETFADRRRVVFGLSILSPGDPPPNWARDPPAAD